MTDWVVAVITRSPGKVEEDKRWEVAKNRVGRNDPLGSGLFCFSSLLFNSPYCRKFTIFGSRHAVKIVSVSEFVGHNYSKWQRSVGSR